jgi:hypothetical protein
MVDASSFNPANQADDDIVWTRTVNGYTLPNQLTPCSPMAALSLLSRLEYGKYGHHLIAIFSSG